MRDGKNQGLGSVPDDEYGSADWSDSQLMMMLNPESRIPSNYTIDNDGYVLDANGNKIYKKPGSYYNRTTGYKPNNVTIDEGLTEEEINFSTKGLTEEAKLMIGESLWPLGQSSSVYPNSAYQAERSKSVSNSSYATEWIGEIGLIYYSDMAFATGKTTCWNSYLTNWGDTCTKVDWLYNSNSMWTMNMKSASSIRISFSMGSGVYGSYSVFPTTYLKSNIKILNGTGVIDDPFILGI